MRSLVGRRLPVLFGTWTLLVGAVASGEVTSWTAPVASESGAVVRLPSLAGEAVLGAKREPWRWVRAHRIDQASPLWAGGALAAVAAAVLQRLRFSGLAVGWACLTCLCCAGAVRAPPPLRLA